LRYVLGHVQDYCLEEKLPPLTILVVHGSGDRKPGTGFIAWDVDTLEQGRALVYGFKWMSIPNPFAYATDGTTQADLVDALLGNPDQAEDVYQRVKVRGVAQAIFREALMGAYAEACAFCGLSFHEALDAAHIHPWASCSKKDRVNVRNGILLCANHHRMFDNGYLSVTETLSIQHCDPKKLDGSYSNIDDLMSAKLHGKKMRLPSAPILRPDPKLIAARRALDGWDD
jgi:putative restriction endonuclease